MKDTSFIKYLVFIITFIFLFSCGSENCKSPISPNEKAYQIKVINMQTWDFGTSYGQGFCGWMIAVSGDSIEKNNTFYKPINIPNEFTKNLFAIYEGEIEILPQTFNCTNGQADPFPNKPPTIETFHLINIISYKRK